MRITSVRDIGAVLREERRHHRITQAELATRLGVSRSWVVALENGRGNPVLATVLDACHLLGVPLTTSDQPYADDPRPGVDLDAILDDVRWDREDSQDSQDSR